MTAGEETDSISGFTFYLGGSPHFFAHTQEPLFISNRSLKDRTNLPRARGAWALDSGAFTELERHGAWHYGPTPLQYAGQIRRYQAEIGGLTWAAPQDWVCEPWIVARTGLTVSEHQSRTVGNFLDLRAVDARLPVIPVVQGWTLADYERCVARYAAAGVDLCTYPVVGLGSVCRRQATAQVTNLVLGLARMLGRRLHGFGFKIEGLRRSAHLMVSADSMAWSAAGRRHRGGCDFRLPGSLGPHRSEANCLRYALTWRRSVIAACGQQQLAFDITS